MSDNVPQTKGENQKMKTEKITARITEDEKESLMLIA